MDQKGQTVLETPRLVIRQWLPEDCLRLRPLVTDPRVLKYIGNAEPWSDDRLKNFVNGGIEHAKTRGWVLWPLIYKADSNLIGFCGFNSAFAPEDEIGWWLLPDYWGRGLATEAAKAVLEYGFRTFKFPRVISVAQPANTPSTRIMQKLGMHFDRSFVHQGKDVVSYAINNPGTATNCPQEAGLDL
jgi:RimJ/RimL family protein N-acetyltransferase